MFYLFLTEESNFDGETTRKFYLKSELGQLEKAFNFHFKPMEVNLVHLFDIVKKETISTEYVVDRENPIYEDGKLVGFKTKEVTRKIESIDKEELIRQIKEKSKELNATVYDDRGTVCKNNRSMEKVIFTFVAEVAFVDKDNFEELLEFYGNLELRTFNMKIQEVVNDVYTDNSVVSLDQEDIVAIICEG